MKNHLIFLFLFTCYTFNAQPSETIITISFNNATIEEVIQDIEEKIPYQFYFIDEWLPQDRYSASYESVPLTQVLDDLLKDTLLNYYIGNDNNIVLTKNTAIYDQLPSGFFEPNTQITESDDVDDTTNVPVFFNEVRSSEPIKVETVRIGKANKQDGRSQFKLRGRITNETNGGAVANLAIVVKGQNVGVETDDNGNFEIDLSPGLNVLETQSLAFEKVQKRVIIYNDGRLDFSLNEAYEGLDEVYLETKVDNNVKEVTGGTTDIKVKEIKNIPLVLGERDIFKVAASQPGITNAGEGASGYNVRGGKTDQNLVLLDDGVLYNPAHFFGIFSAVNPFTTSEIKIYKGNVPAKYGGRLSSVFDIRTKDANVEKISGEGSIGPITANVALELPVVKEKAGVLVAGRGTYSNWILRSLDEPQLQNSEASFYDFIVKYNHELGEKDDLKVTGYYSRDAFSITTDSVYGYSNRMFSVRWNHKFNDKNSGTAILSNSENKFSIDYDGDANTDFELGYRISETELKLNFEYLLNDSHTIEYGISSKLYNSDPGYIDPLNGESIVSSLNIPDERGLESAIYVSDVFTVTDKLTLDAGIRYSFFNALGASAQRIYEEGLPKSEATLIETRSFGKNETITTYSAPEFRTSVRYLLTSDFSVKASFNTNTQYIHALSSNTTVSPTDTWKLSDLNIKPQKSKQYSLGFYKNLVENTYELSMEGYYKTTSDILDYKTGAQLLLNESIEQEVLQGDGKAYGIEFLLKKTKGKLNGWLGYTYSKTMVQLDSEFAEERVNNGDFFPSNYDKPHDFSLVVNYKFTKRFSLSANFVYQTGRPVTVPVGNFVINNSEFVLYSDRNEFRIPDYYRFDIGFNIEGNHKIKKLGHSFWNISIYNVFGRNNPYSVFFVNEDGDINAYQSSIFSVPIPTITYNFSF